MGVGNFGFELGVSGTTPATISNDGLAVAQAQADGDPWSFRTVVAGGTLILDSTRAALGAMSCKVATAGTAGQSLLAWSEGQAAAFGTQTDHYGRAYLYFTANPAAITHFVSFQNLGVAACRIALDTAGKLRILDAGNVSVGTSTNAIALNQWIRVEWHFIHSATVGQGELVLYNTATSGTATETLTTAANKNLNTQATRAQFGIVNNLANVTAFWFDQIQAGASAYPGPAPVGKASRMLLGVG